MGSRESTRVSVTMIGVIALAALALGFWIPMPAPRPFDASMPPGASHLLGTSPYGHDMLAYVATATLRSAAQAIWGASLTLVIAAGIGFCAGFRPNGLFDQMQSVAARLLDSLGPFLIAACLVTVAPRLGPWSLGPVLALLVWPSLSGVIRTETIRLLDSPGLEAARALGLPPIRIATRHLLPAMAARVLPPAVVFVGAFVGLYGALGFLGVGVSSEASLGFLVFDSVTFIHFAPWYFASVAGGFVILLSAVAIMAAKLDPNSR